MDFRGTAINDEFRLVLNSTLGNYTHIKKYVQLTYASLRSRAKLFIKNSLKLNN